MKKIETSSSKQGMERRQFLKLTAAGGFTTAVIASAAGTLGSSEAVAQTAKEERERRKAADHVMTLATAYVIGASRSYPILQLDLKENIQNATNGKVYVKLAPGGQLGAGGALAQKVQTGTIQAAQHSLSNFAPFAPVTRNHVVPVPVASVTNAAAGALVLAHRPGLTAPQNIQLRLYA